MGLGLEALVHLELDTGRFGPIQGSVPNHVAYIILALLLAGPLVTGARAVIQLSLTTACINTA